MISLFVSRFVLLGVTVVLAAAPACAMPEAGLLPVSPGQNNSRRSLVTSAEGQPGGDLNKLVSMASILFCTYRFQGSSSDEALDVAINEIRSQFHSIMPNDIDVVVSATKLSVPNVCPEAFPREPRVIEEVQMPGVRSEVGLCTPTIWDANRISRGEFVALKTDPKCQVIFNSPRY